MIWFTGVVITIAAIEFVTLIILKGEAKYKADLKSDLVSSQLKFISSVVNSIMPLQKYRDGKSGLRQINIYTRQISDILKNMGE